MVRQDRVTTTTTVVVVVLLFHPFQSTKGMVPHGITIFYCGGGGGYYSILHVVIIIIIGIVTTIQHNLGHPRPNGRITCLLFDIWMIVVVVTVVFCSKSVVIMTCHCRLVGARSDDRQG